MKIFNSTLFGPVQYYAHLANEKEVLIETSCYYERKSYRNRYSILGATGVISLSVPIEKRDKKCFTKDVKISYDNDWQHQHWKSIESAYNSSPYFLYYKDELHELIFKRWEKLLEFNNATTKWIMECIDIDTNISFTKEYHTVKENDFDTRELILPKNNCNNDKFFHSIPYRQIFNIEKEFVKNLSILDLLFNKGPEALLILKESYKQQ